MEPCFASYFCNTDSILFSHSNELPHTHTSAVISSGKESCQILYSCLIKQSMCMRLKYMTISAGFSLHKMYAPSIIFYKYLGPSAFLLIAIQLSRATDLISTPASYWILESELPAIRGCFLGNQHDGWKMGEKISSNIISP